MKGLKKSPAYTKSRTIEIINPLTTKMHRNGLLNDLNRTFHESK